MLNVPEIKSVPYVTMSRPFLECFIDTVGLGLLNQVPLWPSRNLQRKLAQFRNFYSDARTHYGRSSVTLACKASAKRKKVTSLNNYS